MPTPKSLCKRRKLSPPTQMTHTSLDVDEVQGIRVGQMDWSLRITTLMKRVNPLIGSILCPLLLDVTTRNFWITLMSRETTKQNFLFQTGLNA